MQRSYYEGDDEQGSALSDDQLAQRLEKMGNPTLAAVVKNRMSPTSVVETGKDAAMGLADYGSLGMADEAIAKGLSIATGSPYDEVVPEIRKQFSDAAERSPIAYNAAGMLAPMGPMKTISKLSGPAKVAGTAAVMGAFGAGSSEAPMGSPEFAKDVALNVAGGAALGAAPLAKNLIGELNESKLINKSNVSKALGAAGLGSLALMADQSEALAQDKNQRINNFLHNISMIESSGGNNMNHPTSHYGVQKDSQAFGRYGMMPNTIREMANRMRMSGTVPKGMNDIRLLHHADDDQIKQILTDHPEYEDALAHYMADYVLTKFKTPEKAAYAWNNGHNMDKSQITPDVMSHNTYVQKYKAFNKMKKNMAGT